jgi:hypothetical protein
VDPLGPKRVQSRQTGERSANAEPEPARRPTTRPRPRVAARRDPSTSGDRKAQARAGGDCFGARRSSPSSVRGVASVKPRTPSCGPSASTSPARAGDAAQSRREACTGQWRSSFASSTRAGDSPWWSPGSVPADSDEEAATSARGRAAPLLSNSVRVPCSQQTPWRSKARWTSPSNCSPTSRTDSPRATGRCQRLPLLSSRVCISAHSHDAWATAF